MNGRAHFAFVIVRMLLFVPAMALTMALIVPAVLLVMLPVVYWYGLPGMVSLLVSPFVGLFVPSAGHALGRWSDRQADRFEGAADRLIDPVMDVIFAPLTLVLEGTLR